MRTAAALMILVSLGVAPQVALGDVASELASIEKLKGRLQYAEALTATDAVLVRGEADRDQLARIYRLRAELAAGVGDDAKATESFANYLALEPKATLPPGSSPKILVPFSNARARNAGKALALRHKLTGDRLEIEIEDPTKLVGRLDITIAGVSIQLTGPPYAHPLPGRSEPAIIQASDQFGNVLATSEPIAPSVSDDFGDPSGSKLSLTSPLPWLIAAAALGATSLTFGVLARSDQSDLDQLYRDARADPVSVSYDEIRRVEKQGRRRALVTNIAAGAAAAAGITAAAMWWFGRDSEPEVAPTVAVTPDGVGFSVGLAF